jgi:hypothetical protein
VYGWYFRRAPGTVLIAGAGVLLAGGMVLLYVGCIRALDAVAGLGIGLLGGGPTGVKYGSARFAVRRGEAEDRPFE